MLNLKNTLNMVLLIIFKHAKIENMNYWEHVNTMVNLPVNL